MRQEWSRVNEKTLCLGESEVRRIRRVPEPQITAQVERRTASNPPVPKCEGPGAPGMKGKIRRTINGILFRGAGDGKELECEGFVSWMELDLDSSKIVDQVVGGVELFGGMRERGGDYDAACRTTCLGP